MLFAQGCARVCYLLKGVLFAQGCARVCYLLKGVLFCRFVVFGQPVGFGLRGVWL